MPKKPQAKQKSRKAVKENAASPQPIPLPQYPKFPVVGIGASAGGLEAFSALLRHLQPNTGMAFVLVQHMDPKHASLLPELLSKVSPMPLVQACDRMKVEPNSVYVIPSDMDIEIQDSILRLFPRTAVRGQHLPIDRFFRSLAAEVGTRAIGVILSGSSTDGVLGIETIKAEGGITFAQDEQTAKFDSMPRAAISRGCIDFVLPPEEIARELIRIGQHPYISGPDSDAAAAEPVKPIPPPSELDRIFAMLRAATLVDFTLYKRSTIQRRISRRMTLHRLESLDAYLSLLQQNPSELQELYREILIKVTSFFRDPEVFKGLTAKVFPELVQRLRADTPLRIWIPGCATGEEVYSIAITLLEYLNQTGRHIPVQVFATDISDEAIDHARTGIYIENIASDVSPERLRRFFVKVEGGYQVNKMVRDLCIFARHDLIRDPPFSRLDLISCRNVLIYLDSPLQKRVLPMFHYALKHNGYLMLGSSETITAFSDLFHLEDKKHRFYIRRQVASPQRFEFESGPMAVRAEGVRTARGAAENQGSLDVQREADRAVLARYAPAGVVINEDYEVVQYRGKTGPYLEPSPGRASLNVLKMAREGLLVELRSAVQRAKRTGEMVVRRNIATKDDRGFRDINFEVVPLRATPGGRHYLVLFEEAKPEPQATDSARKLQGAGDRRQTTQLKQELVATREYLQSIIDEQAATNEELQSANEEILSSNEELQSINEELETAKEELQATNEELTTVNEELQNRNAEVTQTNDDLNNLLAAMNVAIVMLGSDLRVRRFTPAAGRILSLIPSDLGRPIGDLRPRIDVPDLEDLIAKVVDTVAVQEREVVDKDGRWYSMAIRPYRTSDNRIEGAVLTLFDIDPLKRSLEEARLARGFTSAVVDTAADPLVVLDRQRCITQANPAFFELVRTAAQDLDGQRIDDVLRTGRELPALLNEASRGTVVRDREFDFRNGSEKRTVLASARIMQDGQGLIVLSLRDITERKAAEAQLRDSEVLYRELFQNSFNSSKRGLLLVDGQSGEIREVNPFLAKLVGGPREDLIGKKLWDTPEFRPIAASWETFLKERARFDLDDVVLRNKDGQPVRGSLTVSQHRAGKHMLVQLNFRPAARG